MRLHHFIQDLLGDPIHWACLLQLHKHAPLGGRELARRTDTSQFKIRHVLDNLYAQGLLKKEIHGRTHLYSLNRLHYLVKKVLPLLDLEVGFLSYFGAWVLRHLSAKPLAILLYGSAVRHQERPDSDIDLLLIYAKDPPGEEEIVAHLAPSAEHFGNRISPLIITPALFKEGVDRREPLFLEILKEGMVLHGLSKQEILQWPKR